VAHGIYSSIYGQHSKTNVVATTNFKGISSQTITLSLYYMSQNGLSYPDILTTTATGVYAYAINENTRPLIE